MATDVLDELFNAEPKIQNLGEDSNAIPEFKPNVKKGQGGVYTAVIRFLPNPKNPANKSIILKNTVYLENPMTHEKMEVDCPSTIGQPDPIQDTFFSLRNSENPVLKNNAAKFSRRSRYASLVQVLSCPSEPNLVGKILVWRYGIKIYNKIYAEQNPPVGIAHNPFNLLSGRPMYLKIKEVSGYNNYDECLFVDYTNPNESALRIEVTNAQGNQVWVPITQQILQQDPTLKQRVSDYLNEKCPPLESFEYKEWDEHTRKFVKDCIDIYTNPQLSMGAITGGNMQQMPQAPMQQPHMTAVPEQPTVIYTPQQTVPVNMPNMQQMPQMPQMQVPGVQLNQPTPGPAVQTPGFNSTGIPTDLDKILNSNTGGMPAASAGQPTLGGNLDLDDVLNGIM